MAKTNPGAKRASAKDAAAGTGRQPARTAETAETAETGGTAARDGARTAPTASGSTEAAAYAGARLGLPESGVGSVAGIGRRLAGFAVDVVVANGLSFLAFGNQGPGGLWVLAMFAAETWLFVSTTGGSLGHHAAGLQVVRLNRRPVGLWRGFVRTFLVCLFIPIMVWDRDQRGLHDLAAGTVLVRRR